MSEETKLKQGKGRNYLHRFLQLYPHVPSQAFWRALEANLFSEVTLAPPVLDLGCGDGSFMYGIMISESRIDFGCDLSVSSLAKAKKFGVYRALNSANARKLPYRSNSFATIISNCVIEHILEPDEVLREVARVLVAGGRFFFTVPSDRFCKQLYFYKHYCKHGKTEQAAEYIAKINTRLAHLHYYSLETWKAKLSESGLILKNARTYLSPSSEEIWDRLLAYNTGLAPKTNFLHSILLSSRLPRNHLWKRLVISYFEIYLRHYWIRDTSMGEPGGAWFLEAQKPGNAMRRQ